MNNSNPFRFSCTTFNVWRDYNWNERSIDLTNTLLQLRSDIFLFQEINSTIIEHFDSNLVGYSRVFDDNQEGWKEESNIFFKTSMFELVEHGFGDLGLRDYPLRGLFWARLRLVCDPSKTIFVSTVHFPWAGSDLEIETGVNQRILASIKVCEHFRRLVPFNELAILGGDFNDDFHPLRILGEECALIDVFEAMDLPPPITHPVRPSSYEEEMRPNRTLDWITCCLPSSTRVIAAFAKTTRGGRVPISDHYPVVAFFEINN